MQPVFLGIEIGGTKLQILAGDGPTNILQRHRFSVDPARGADGIRAQLEAVLKQIVPTLRPAGVGAGFGGPVDWRTGKICRSHQIEGWSEFDLGDWLQGLTGVPVCVENDANTAALSEALHGAGVGANPVFYVTLGSGVGGGLVLDGRIYHGASPGEAEIGHVRLDRQGTIVENRCAGWAVDAKIRAFAATNPASLLAKLTAGKSGGEAAHLNAALQKNDPVARQILQETAEDLAFGLSHVVHLFHPEVIVIGGGLTGIGVPLRDAVATALRPLVMEVFLPGPRTCLAALAEDAVPVGALHLARECHLQKLQS